MVRILTVCTGNVCRSPLAEAILRQRLSGRGARISSVGIRAMVDHPMTPEALRLAGVHGVAAEIADSHRARLASEHLLGDADLILAMAREHRRHVVELVPSRLRVTFTVRELARLAREVTDAELAEELARFDEPARRLRAALGFISSLRHLSQPPADPADDDVLDPYGRPWETYERSAAQLVPAIDQVERILRISLGSAVAPDAIG